MQPKRTITTNYYDCYEVGYIKLYGRNGEPEGQTKNVIIKTLDKDGVLKLANKYGIELVDADDIYSTGYYIKEVETTVDPDTFHDELPQLESVFKEEAELQKMEKQHIELLDKMMNWDNFIQHGDTFSINPEIEKEYKELETRIKELDYKLHG